MHEPRAAVGALARAAAGGLCYCLGFVGWGVWPLLLVFLVPLWSALERVRPRGAWWSLTAGFVFGAAAYAGGFLWLWRLVDPFLDGDRTLGAALWAAYGVSFALGFAGYAALYHGIRRRAWPLAPAGIAPLVLIEWLQPQVFPVYAGSALVPLTTWIQVADLGGPLLLTGLVAAANVVVFETWSWMRARRPAPRAIWAAGLVLALLTAGYGQARIGRLDRMIAGAPALRVGIVQANLGLLEKREQSLVAQRRHLEQTRALVAGGAVDLVVWPETAYVRGLRRPLPLSGQPISEDLSVPLLFGGTSVFEEQGQRRKANSAFLIGPDGMIRDAYDKNLLIPLAEAPPLARFVPASGARFPHLQDFTAARDTPPLRLGSWRIATPICYEAIRPDFVRRMVRTSNPHLLVTLANDAWFGDSQEPWMHLALSRLRAVEHRRFLVRSTNSGVSAVVDPAGRILARTGLLTRETLRATVHLLEGRTVYGRFGDWPGWLAALAVVLTLGSGARGARAATPPARPRR